MSTFKFNKLYEESENPNDIGFSTTQNTTPTLNDFGLKIKDIDTYFQGLKYKGTELQDILLSYKDRLEKSTGNVFGQTISNANPEVPQKDPDDINLSEEELKKKRAAQKAESNKSTMTLRPETLYYILMYYTAIIPINNKDNENFDFIIRDVASAFKKEIDSLEDAIEEIDIALIDFYSNYVLRNGYLLTEANIGMETFVESIAGKDILDFLKTTAMHKRLKDLFKSTENLNSIDKIDSIVEILSAPGSIGTKKLKVLNSITSDKIDGVSIFKNYVNTYGEMKSFKDVNDDIISRVLSSGLDVITPEKISERPMFKWLKEPHWIQFLQISLILSGIERYISQKAPAVLKGKSLYDFIKSYAIEKNAQIATKDKVSKTGKEDIANVDGGYSSENLDLFVSSIDSTGNKSKLDSIYSTLDIPLGANDKPIYISKDSPQAKSILAATKMSGIFAGSEYENDVTAQIWLINQLMFNTATTWKTKAPLDEWAAAGDPKFPNETRIGTHAIPVKTITAYCMAQISKDGTSIQETIREIESLMKNPEQAFSLIGNTLKEYTGKDIDGTWNELKNWSGSKWDEFKKWISGDSVTTSKPIPDPTTQAVTSQDPRNIGSRKTQVSKTSLTDKNYTKEDVLTHINAIGTIDAIRDIADQDTNSVVYKIYKASLEVDEVPSIANSPTAKIMLQPLLGSFNVFTSYFIKYSMRWTLDKLPDTVQEKPKKEYITTIVQNTFNT